MAAAAVSAKQVERAAESLGDEIAEAENKQVDKTGTVAPTMDLEMDGTGVPMRTQQVIGRAGKQTDGSSKTRDAKRVTVWTAESRDDRGKPMRDSGSVSYSAAIESAATPDTSPQLSDFAERVFREANRRGFNEAPRPERCSAMALPGYGIQPRSYSPQAVQILDRFHANEHISDIGKLLFPDGLERKGWILSRSDELDQGRLAALVKALRLSASRCKEALNSIRYIWNYRSRMRYRKFHLQG